MGLARNTRRIFCFKKFGFHPFYFLLPSARLFLVFSTVSFCRCAIWRTCSSCCEPVCGLGCSKQTITGWFLQFFKLVLKTCFKTCTYIEIQCMKKDGRRISFIIRDINENINKNKRSKMDQSYGGQCIDRFDDGVTNVIKPTNLVIVLTALVLWTTLQVVLF